MTEKHLKLICDKDVDHQKGDFSDEPYSSRPNTYSSWHVYGIELLDKSQYNTLPAGFDVDIGDTVYCVYVIYSTGNSFGHDARGSMEIVSFHKDAKVAYANQASINAYQKAQAELSRQRWSDNKTKVTIPKLIITQDSGDSAELTYVPWEGYFESLDSVNVEYYNVAPAGSVQIGY